MILDGYIPACAGETGGIALDRRLEGGTSPRVRGKLQEGTHSAPGGKGYIPACAGETFT